VLVVEIGVGLPCAETRLAEVGQGGPRRTVGHRAVHVFKRDLGSILQNSISAEKFSGQIFILQCLTKIHPNTT
jgi:hypothetical protein